MRTIMSLRIGHGRVWGATAQSIIWIYNEHACKLTEFGTDITWVAGRAALGNAPKYLAYVMVGDRSMHCVEHP